MIILQGKVLSSLNLGTHHNLKFATWVVSLYCVNSMLSGLAEGWVTLFGGSSMQFVHRGKCINADARSACSAITSLLCPSVNLNPSNHISSSKFAKHTKSFIIFTSSNNTALALKCCVHTAQQPKGILCISPSRSKKTARTINFFRIANELDWRMKTVYLNQKARL